MNDVNLITPGLKLVCNGEQAPARAISSSQAEGRNAADHKATSAGSTGNDPSVQHASEPSRSERLEERREKQKKEMDDAVTQLNDFVQNVQRDLQFEVDNEAGQTIVKVVDQETREVIRQIPDEVALRLAENLHQDEPLTLFNIRV